MAATGLLALLDDITTILDDIAAMSKIAAQKTAGIAGDDLAVNAQGLVGIEPKRELPIVWEVAKGSMKNKAFLVPGALVLSAVAPWAITPILMAGGAFLCYEGIEKVLHKSHGKEDEQHHKELTAAAMKSGDALLNLEKAKIKQAINTDLILSAEIVAVTLGAVAAAPFVTQVGVLTAVAVGMTVGIYGLVGGIVKIDDVGLHLSQKTGDGAWAKAQRGIGNALLKTAPHFMKTLSVVGTAAMFAVGGGIILHGIPGVEHALHGVSAAVTSSGFLQGVVGMGIATLGGVAAGFASLGAVKALEKPLAKPLAALRATTSGLYDKIFKKKPDITIHNAPEQNASKALPAPVAAQPSSAQQGFQAGVSLTETSEKTFGRPACFSAPSPDPAAPQDRTASAPGVRDRRP